MTSSTGWDSCTDRWHLICVECVGAGRMCTMPKAFPKEFREDVIRVYRDSFPPSLRSGRTSAITPSCLQRWLMIDERRSGGRSGQPAAGQSDELREANKRIRLLEQENEVLRRATALCRRPTCQENEALVTLPWVVDRA